MTESQADAPAVDAAELAAWQRDGRSFTVLDVRNRDEFEAWHVDAEAIQIPHQQFIAARARGTTDERVPAAPQSSSAAASTASASASSMLGG
ncbi:rhodanese-like domain-containing protein [Halolamina sediminis]|jgi:rhodanese-related sulfurtransferase|uniref:rhodanese-like domain-containing protein n=1 Tax=Halolamina sediminis TaxID=1480675 RepID=UPI0006B62B7F|nr:rhodanese-like domain-containing protein [Halolamina sediminis]